MTKEQRLARVHELVGEIHETVYGDRKPKRIRCPRCHKPTYYPEIGVCETCDKYFEAEQDNRFNFFDSTDFTQPRGRNEE